MIEFARSSDFGHSKRDSSISRPQYGIILLVKGSEIMNQTKIVVNMGSQRDGFIFGLRPRSRVWLEDHYSDRHRVSSVFIGLDKIQDFQQIHESILGLVLNLLTGLSLEELDEFGDVAIFSPASGQEVLNSKHAHV